eukprot:3298417-Rhodomonas_salina.2
MATASQKITEIKFLERMRGALMAAPTSDDPVVKIPLRKRKNLKRQPSFDMNPHHEMTGTFQLNLIQL